MIKYISNQAYQLILISVITHLICSVSNCERSKRLLSSISGIFLIVFMLNSMRPIIQAVRDIDFNIDIDNNTEYNDSFNDAFIEAASDELCNSITLLIVNRFELKESDFRVSVTLDTSNIQAIRPTLITITMYIKNDPALNLSISEYISDALATNTLILEN